MITARSTTATATPTPATADPAVTPGKQPLVTPAANASATEARPIASTALPPELAAHAGETFVDGGHYVWRIEPDSSFTCIAQPASATRSSIGAKVTQAKSPDLWQALCALAIDSFGAAPAPAPAPDQTQPAEQPTFSLDGFLAMLGFGPLPDIGSLVTDLVESLFGDPEAETPTVDTPTSDAPTSEVPAPETPAPQTGSPATEPTAPTPDAPAPEQGGGGAPAAINNVHRCVSRDARLRDETGKELAPKAVVPVSAYVRVVERKTASKPMARVELLSSIDAASGSELGWTNESNLAPLVRAPRPSDPAGQMAAVLAAAKSRIGNEAVGLCYRFVKGHITAAGGYGDILDIYQDERFEGFQGSAVDFAAAVQKHGAAALGLEEVGGAPANAEPGTLLVTRGNGKIRLSEEHGDIAVIGGVERGCIICYNDHRMKLVADPEAWISGDYAGVLVGMYRPIARK